MFSQMDIVQNQHTLFTSRMSTSIRMKNNKFIWTDLLTYDKGYLIYSRYSQSNDHSASSPCPKIRA